MTLTPLWCDRRGHKDQSAQWVRQSETCWSSGKMERKLLSSATTCCIKQTGEWGVAGGGQGKGRGWCFSLGALQGAAGEWNCDLWKPELCCNFSWNLGLFWGGRGDEEGVRGQEWSEASSNISLRPLNQFTSWRSRAGELMNNLSFPSAGCFDLKLLQRLKGWFAMFESYNFALLMQLV